MAREVIDSFRYARGQRVKITNAQSKQIDSLYREIASEVAQSAKHLENKTNISSAMRKQYLNALVREIEENIKVTTQTLESTIQKNALATSEAVVLSNVNYLHSLGLDIKQAYFYVPKDIVNEVITGKLYKGRWTLSRALWGDSKQTIQDLHTIVAKGIAENKSAYDIAKDLERYVQPGARKKWEWSKVYPGTKKKIDYNAQRLARTMVSHAYQESFVRVTKNNPFIDAYRWLISNSDRVCPVCLARAEDDQYGLGAGVYPKNQLPLDHPNGMCTFEAIQLKTYDQITNDLTNWINGTGSDRMNKQLDVFAYDLLQGEKESAVKEVKKSYKK